MTDTFSGPTRALVTGAGRRLGQAFALDLAACGMQVAVHYGNSAAGAAETASTIAGQGGKAVALQADLAHPDQAGTLVQRAVEEMGEVDCLINSASVFDPGGIETTDEEVWDRNQHINLRAPFLLAREFLKHRAGRPGVIVNILDWRALRPGRDHFAYTVSKAGLAAMTRSLALSQGPAVRVNGLALGAILPPEGEQAQWDRVLEKVPAGRAGTVEEVCQALRFLVQDSAYITGQILLLDGGRHLQL